MTGRAARMLAAVSFDETTLRLALLAVATGVLAAALGSWVVLRRQAFLAHASGATAFAGASVAGALVLPVLPLAIATAAGVAALTGRLAARRAEIAQVATGLALACGLAVGVIAASSADATGSSAALLGSTLLASDGDVLAALGIAALSVLLARIFGRWWLAGAVHPHGAAAVLSGAPRAARLADLALLLMAGVAAAALLPVAGALLAGTLLVVPAATAQRLAPHPARMVPLTGRLAGTTMLAALVIADRSDLPPGACAALLAAVVDLLVVGWLRARRSAGAAGSQAVAA